MSATANPATAPADRAVPPWGGFNLRYVRLEIRRLLRNRRTLIFTVVLPPFFYLIFGAGQSYANDSAGHGNVAAFVMISMAIYGAMLATTSGGAMVSIERAAGWSRQLRLTPLSPVAYIVIKLLTAMVLGAIPVIVVFALGRVHGAHMQGHLWFETAIIAWVGSIVFAAFGLFMGYLLPSENVMQILGPILALLAFAGGLFIPLSQMDHTFRDIAQFTPMYGLNELVHAPLTGDAVHVSWLLNLLAWLAIFAGGAIWRFRKDTARV
jgi:ABC-2 type transport system permease protein